MCVVDMSHSEHRPMGKNGKAFFLAVSLKRMAALPLVHVWILIENCIHTETCLPNSTAHNNPISLFLCFLVEQYAITPPLCSTLYNKHNELPGTEVSLAESPPYPTSANLCLFCLSVFSLVPHYPSQAHLGSLARPQQPSQEHKVTRDLPTDD